LLGDEAVDRCLQVNERMEHIVLEPSFGELRKEALDRIEPGIARRREMKDEAGTGVRYPILDGFRGFFLIFMVIIHTNEDLKTLLGKLNHHYFGWVEDAQGFIFISGLVVGLVYAGISIRSGDAAMRRAVWKRIRTIYKYQASLIILMLFVALGLGVSAHHEVLAPYIEMPVSFTTASLMLVAASRHMGILPMYIYFMALTPLTLIAFRKNLGFAVAIISGMIWMLAQTGISSVAVDAIEDAIRPVAELELGIFFNIAGWQVIYVGGLYLGYKLANNELSLEWLKKPEIEVAACFAFVGILALGVFDRIIFNDIISEEFSNRFIENNPRKNFSPIYLIAFLLDLFFITWILVAGSTSRIAIFRAVSRFFTWLLHLPILTRLGQYSLQVFAFHIVVVYTVSLVFGEHPPGQVVGTIVLLVVVASLYIPVQIQSVRVRRNKRRLEAAPR
jgi:hypothetical protein